MKTFVFCSLAAATLVAGCTTPIFVSPVEVTRFAGSQPAMLGQGPILVVPAPGQMGGGWDAAAYQTAVASRLRALGYTPVGTGAAQIAEVSFGRATDQPPRRSPVSVGVGGSTGSYGGGIGGGIGIDLSPRPSPVTDTELRVVIRPVAGGQPYWEGRAHFAASANSPYADPRAAADRLAGALFTGFPGRSGETIEVR